jgi:DNA-binding GntR family transcriptional regulator
MNTLAISLLKHGESGKTGKDSGSASQRVYEELRRRIVSLALPPGTVLSRSELTKELGVSLTPVREALQQLEAEGLVRIYPQSKTLVTRLAVDEIEEAQLVRVAIETEVVRRLAASCPQATLDRLTAIVDMQEALSDKPGELAMFVELDELFHRTLMAGVGHENLHDLLKSRSGQFSRLRRLHLPDAGKIADIISDHKAIVAALAAADPDQSEKAMRAHLSQTISKVNDLRAQYPNYFT